MVLRKAHPYHRRDHDWPTASNNLSCALASFAPEKCINARRKMRAVLFGGSYRQQDDSVVHCLLSQLFGGHAVPQYFGHDFSRDDSEHRKPASSNAPESST